MREICSERVDYATFFALGTLWFYAGNSTRNGCVWVVFKQQSMANRLWRVKNKQCRLKLSFTATPLIFPNTGLVIAPTESGGLYYRLLGNHRGFLLHTVLHLVDNDRNNNDQAFNHHLPELADAHHYQTISEKTNNKRAN